MNTLHKIVVLFFLVFFYGYHYTSGQIIVGKNPCTWGPAFWCNNFTNAMHCGDMVGWCIEKVWSDASYGLNGDLNCDTCKHLVMESRGLVESDTDEDVKQVFKEECLRHNIENCDNFVQYDGVIQMLSSKMTAQAICKVLSLCDEPSQETKDDIYTDYDSMDEI